MFSETRGMNRTLEGPVLKSKEERGRGGVKEGYVLSPVCPDGGFFPNLLDFQSQWCFVFFGRQLSPTEGSHRRPQFQVCSTSSRRLRQSQG